MKKIVFLVISFLFFSSVFACEIYQENNKFGIKDGEKIVLDAKYDKLITLEDKSYLFMYKNKYGIIDTNGNIIVHPSYTHAQRYMGKFVKFGINNKYCVYDANGNLIIAPNYTSIDVLYGGMFLVCRKHKYGLIGFDGKTILPSIADDIYVPKPNVIRINVNNNWYEVERIKKEAIQFPDAILAIKEDDDFGMVKIINSPFYTTSYGLISFGDYFIKIFSTISPSYEKSIDELLFSHGADTADILTKSSWLFKFPYTYLKNYAFIYKTPNNGPFSDIKSSIKTKI